MKISGEAVDRRLGIPISAWCLRHIGDLGAVRRRPQTLRLYERRGLLSPSRTDAGTRRYSDDDLERLQRITELVDQGVNLAGIAHILDLETKNSQLESDYTQLEVLNATLKADQQPKPRRHAAPKERRQDSGHGRRRRNP